MNVTKFQSSNEACCAFKPTYSIRCKKEAVSSDDEYSLRECFTKNDVATCTDWGPNQHVTSKKRLRKTSGNLEYVSMNENPFVKTTNSTSSDSSINISEHSDEMLVKNELIKYSSEPFTEFECQEDSDVSIEKFEPPQFIFDKVFNPDIENDRKPKILTLEDWLQLPNEQYVQHCAMLPNHNQLHNSFSEDDDPDLQNSYTRNQSSVHHAQGSQANEPSMYSSQNALQIRVNENSRIYHKNQVKRSSDLFKVKPINVEKWKKTTLGDQLRSQVFTKSGDKCGLGKNSNTRERLKVENKKSHHNDRRITRSLIKSTENTSPIEKTQNSVGKIVWGYCMGWWPVSFTGILAIVVNAEDGGLKSTPDKVCVYWIGEDLISLLNEKTQIEPFSTNLNMRLLRYLKDNEASKDKRKATFVTLKLFSKYLKIPLLKPYFDWAEKHLLGKNYLNEVKFYPFPKNMQQRLEQLKQQNNKASEKITQDKACANRLSMESSSSNDQKLCNNLDNKIVENGPRKKFPKDFVRKSLNELLLHSSEEQPLPLMDQKPGVIVWGKMTGHNWWPAMIIHNHDCGHKEPNFGYQWILWYGDYQLSQVNYQNLMTFDEGIKKMYDYITQCRRRTYIKAVLNACKDHCARLNYDTSNWTIDDVLSWASSLNSSLMMRAIPRPNDGRLESRYSSHMADKLIEMKSNQEVSPERENQIRDCDSLKTVFTDPSDILKTLCIICLKTFDDALQDHPFFECAVCSTCVEELKATIFAYGDDGKCFFCTLCTGSDTIVMCDSLDCSRVYCTACLKYLISPKEYNEILVKDPWLCFLCDETQDSNKNRLFKPRSDWKTRIGQLFHTRQDISWNITWDNDDRTKNMRVLSLFDGISTGLVVLDKLGIVVEDYYASEIDLDAEAVGTAHFGDRVTRLGDVRNITKDIIDAIAPIDLLIGGSPCNDLSLVNPNGLGLHDPKGTGILFFDYCRIMKLIIEANKGRHLFWIFENVAFMKSKHRLAINEALQCEPSLIDAADFSPQHRPRLFWGNLPSGIDFPPPDPCQYLQSVLTPNCNRHALVKKIRTVTTKVNSLKQGVSLCKPVLMNGVADSLWITELEEIFGFPKHYTDVKNLCATQRQKLIGQAWSVQTIAALLLPLCKIFNTNANALEVCDE